MEQLEGIQLEQRNRLLPYMDVGWQALSQADGIPDYQPIQAPERAWIARSAEWVSNPAEAILRATSPTHDLSVSVVLEGEPRPEQGSLGVVTAIRDQGPHSVALEVDAAQGGWLVLADTWFPGWVAELDGQSTESYPANGVMRSVWVPAGQHAVAFHYRPITVPIGLVLTVLGLAAFAYLRRK
jgi:hypothetical protein